MNETEAQQLAAEIDSHLADVFMSNAELPHEDQLSPTGWWLCRQAFALGRLTGAHEAHAVTAKHLKTLLP